MNERIFNQICQKILRPGMRRIAMTYSVSNRVFYDTLHDFDMPEFMSDWDCKEEREKSYLRLSRILKRLSLENTVDASKNSVFTSKPKVFDAGMYAAMKNSYEKIVDEIGDRAFFDMLPPRYMDVLEIGGRSGLTFVEMVALSSLYKAVCGPAVNTLNHPLETANQVKRGKPRVKRIMDALHSPELYQSLVRAVYDLLVEIWEKDYKQALETHCRKFWLDEKKRNLKYLDYAMERYALESAKVDEDGTKDEMAYANELMDFVNDYEFIEMLQFFFTRIWPLAERVALSMNPECDTDYDVSECEYAVAERVGSVVKCYVEGVIRATEVLLECLPEVSYVKMLES